MFVSRQSIYRSSPEINARTGPTVVANCKATCSVSSYLIVIMQNYVNYLCLFRTKALVLELLAAICLVKGGHEIILSAFDNFKEVCQEKKRFQTLMDYFINYEIFHIEFMVKRCASNNLKIYTFYSCLLSSPCSFECCSVAKFN